MKLNNLKTIFFLFLTCYYSTGLTLPVGSGYEISPSSVVVSAKHELRQNKIFVKYEYTILNKETYKNNQFIIGTKNWGEETLLGFSAKKAFNSGAFFKNPIGWNAETFTNEGDINKTMLVWTADTKIDDRCSINVNSIKSGFILYTDKKYSDLLNTYAHIGSDWVAQKHRIVKVIKADSVPPEGKAYISLLKKLNGIKTVGYIVKVNIISKDNLDSYPEINFLSLHKIENNNISNPFLITNYKILGNNSLAGYSNQFLIDTVSIPVIYRLTYKITDASDNSSIITSDFTIPSF